MHVGGNYQSGEDHECTYYDRKKAEEDSEQEDSGPQGAISFGYGDPGQRRSPEGRGCKIKKRKTVVKIEA